MTGMLPPVLVVSLMFGTLPTPDTSGPNRKHGGVDKIDLLVGRGDRLFEKAMKHLRKSDPNLNPKGWKEENAKALTLFKEANRACFIPAQDEYPDGNSVPKVLLDRIRETTLRASLCRKRDLTR